ncbi:MAG: acyl-CoA thioesterase [Myxococcota bacterium]|nr:acyl-CoA thioesterase [Myxococcota bacterium]
MAGVPSFPLHTPRTNAEVPLRFEDVTQDGRLVLESLPTALFPTVWSVLARDQGIQAIYGAGIVPILSRLLLEGTPGPFPATATAAAEGASRLVRTQEGRFLLEMWSDLRVHAGRTYAPPGSASGGPLALAGRVFAEHVLTRPFAPPGARRVASLDFDGAPEVRESEPAPLPLDAPATLPEGARPLEPVRVLDAVPVTFGVLHTDSNGHVNSLVYLRLFEEAALRRFASLGQEPGLLGRAMDIAYRKPCFVGDTVRVAQQAFLDLGGRPCVAAALVAEKDTASDETLAAARPRAFAWMRFER